MCLCLPTTSRVHENSLLVSKCANIFQRYSPAITHDSPCLCLCLFACVISARSCGSCWRTRSWTGTDGNAGVCLFLQLYCLSLKSISVPQVGSPAECMWPWCENIVVSRPVATCVGQRQSTLQKRFKVSLMYFPISMLQPQSCLPVVLCGVM